MTTSSARLMLFARAQEVLGTQEAEVLMDMLTPGEMFDAWRSDTQAGFSLVRSQLEISETSLRKEILGVHKRLDTLELRVSSLELKFAHLEEKFTHLEDKFELLRQEVHLEIKASEARLMKQIDKRITRMAFGFGIPFVLTNVALVAAVLYR
jgi:predicted RNase H-like nuclease (RuvC/YqgF family)